MKGNDHMSDLRLDQWLEQLAQLIEAKAKTPAEAAQIVRDAKVFRD